MRRTLATTTLVLALAIPVWALPDSGDDAAAETTIRKSLADWVEASNRGDWAAAARIWAPDLIGWYPGYPDDSFQRETEFAKTPHPVTQTSELTIHEVIVSGPLAVVRDTWKFTDRSDKGPGKTTSVRSFEVWRKQPDGSWKIARWISSPEPAAR